MYMKVIKFLGIYNLPYIFYFHAAKIRKILVTSKYSGRNLLLSCSFSIMLRVDAGKRLLKKQKRATAVSKSAEPSDNTL